MDSTPQWLWEKRAGDILVNEYKGQLGFSLKAEKVQNYCCESSIEYERNISRY